MAAVVPMRGGWEAAAAARVPGRARQMGSCTSRKTASFLPRTRRNASTAASAAAAAGSPSSSTALSSSSSSLGGDKVVIKTARTGWAFAGKEKGKRRGGVGGKGGILGSGTGKGTGSVKGFALKVNSVLADVPKELLEQTLQVPAIFPRTAADPKTVASIILGGGAGTRLFPLTMRRAKPAVPIGGCYRLIDVPMSNCINSGINKVYILTQFNSQSLNRHIARTYNVSSGVNFGDGFIEVLAAMQTSGEFGNRWFQGTADAVRQFSWLFEDPKLSQIENILILSGDHLYRMDYIDFLQKHLDSGADVSVSCIPVDDSRASDFGLMKIDKMGRIVQFHEKPKGDSLKAMQVDTTVLGLGHHEAKKFPYIASMGIYLFRTDVLLNLLRHRYPSANDFGSEIIPSAAEEFDVQAYLFNGYWEDIGTIKSFYDANLALTDQPPKFEFYDPSKPIYTSPRFLPPTKYEGCQVSRSIISHGCFLQKCVIDHSVIGLRSRLDYGVEIKDTMMMGADSYQTEAEIASFLAEGRVPIGVGKNTKIRNCIIDKNAKIGQNVIIANSENVEEAERASEGFYIRSGITVVLKNATIPDGTII